MKTRTFGKTGETVSLLGYGCMRFPTKNGRIDEERTERQVVSAIEAGVNYFDTAFLYNGSESVLGRILAKGWRDRVLIADKIPPFRVHARKDLDRHLDVMLERLQTDRIDFLLVHALNDFEGWRRFRACGFDAWLEAVRAAGKVRHIGFSWHGSREDFIRVVDDFDWEFCQIQYNYLDEQFQAGREGMRHAAAKGLGVVIMEPLRGGLLANKPPQPVQALWDTAGSDRTPADWALQWVWNQPEVSLALSGMNAFQQVVENLASADRSGPGTMTAEELALVDRVRDQYNALTAVPCTDCKYCQPCPNDVAIPRIFELYNQAVMFNARDPMRAAYTHWVREEERADNCIECGECETKCPQEIDIIDWLKQVHTYFTAQQA